MGRNSPIGTGHRARTDVAVWFSEWLARRRPSSAVVANAYGKNEPPRAGPGERSKSAGPGAKGVRLAADYRPGFGWQSLALAVVLLVVAIAVVTPKDILNRIINGPPPLSPARPDVLVVSGRWSDHAAVMQTTQARGYVVRAAKDVESGLISVQREADRIGIVVIDGGLHGAGRMANAVKRTCPDARVILLKGPRDAGQISNRLMEAGIQ